MSRNYSIHAQTPAAHQRLPKYKRGDPWIREFLHRGRIAHLGSLWDGQPFVTPTTYFYDESRDRLIFHSNISGRLRTGMEQHAQVCVEVSELGTLLPSNVALEFSLQYRSVMVFGRTSLIEETAEKQAALHALIHKYFSEMKLGVDYRPATEKELKRTSVYQVQIESWSGKENWKDRAEQSAEWPILDNKWFQ